MDIQEIIARWDSGDGKPYKGSIIDWDAYEENPQSMGCMCAQGQILHLEGGWSPERLRDVDQSEADMETARLRNISRAHAVLLRFINDRVDGAPSIVFTDPAKVLGDQWSKVLDFWWWVFHNYSADDWRNVVAAWRAAGHADRDAAATAALTVATTAATAAAASACATATSGAATAAAAATWGSAWEIQGHVLMADRGQRPFFLPMFGINSLDDIPPRPDNYGLGVVPSHKGE
jgi:hypothetical protein